MATTRAMVVLLGAAFLQLPVPISVPVEHAANVFFARTTINGRGPYWLTVDTGATLTVLDPSTAEDLALVVRPAGSRANVGVADAATDMAVSAGALLRIGSAPAFAPSPLYVLRVRAAEATLGRRIDGVLGTDFLRQYVVEFDYAARAVTLHPRGSRDDRAGARVAVRLRGNVLIAPATLTMADGTTVTARLLVDTGSSSGLSLNTPFVRAHDLGRFPTAGLTASVGINGVTTSQVITLASLAVGSAVVSRPNAALSRTASGLAASEDFDGILGAAVLRQFRLTVDYPARQMILEAASRPGPGYTDRY